MSHPDLIIHDENDNVGVVVIETTKKGQDCSAWIMENDKTVKVPSTNEIPLGHKIALKDLKTGDTIFKYGHDIGKVVKDIIVERDWKITERKRNIAGYSCRRAIWNKNDSTRIYAWYTDQLIPSTGPETFNGLPGTILGLATEDGGVVYFAKLVQEKYQNVDELVSEIKIKNFSTEKELKDELIKKSKSNPWMSKVITYLFEW